MKKSRCHSLNFARMLFEIASEDYNKQTWIKNMGFLKFFKGNFHLVTIVVLPALRMAVVHAETTPHLLHVGADGH